MESNRTYANTAIRIALILSALTFLGACRKEKHAPKGASPVISPNGPGQNGGGQGPISPRSSDGTSDPGGGTGVQGKVFEAFIRDPKTMRGYNQYLKPIFDQIESEDKKRMKPGDETEQYGTAGDFFAVKKWFLVPVGLNCVDKDVIGLSFATSNVDVLACQTRTEVWIDENKTKNSSDREFAKLIAHEYVIGMYTLRFEKMSTLYAAMERITGKKIKLEGITLEQIDAMLPPEPVRKLNARDYEIVRAATDWLFEKGATATLEQYELNFERVVMDPRFHNNESNSEKADKRLPIKDIAPDDVPDLLAANHNAGQTVEKCLSPDGKKIADCELSWTITPYGAWDWKVLNLQISGAPQTYSMALYAKNELTPSTDNQRNYYQVSGFDVTFVTQGKKAGDRISIATLYFSSNANTANPGLSNMRLEFVGINQYVVSRVFKKVETENNVQVGRICYEVLESNHRNPWLNNFMAVTKTGPASSLILMVNFMREPICLPDTLIVKPAPQQ